MRTLHLTLHRKWFDLIASGKKDIEKQRQCGGCGASIVSDESLCLKCSVHLGNKVMAWTDKGNGDKELE
jgi:hypothetical protein